jgi:hypothetical protein
MDALMTDAQELFASAQAGSDTTDIAIVIGQSGGIRIVNAQGWELSSLQTEMGAQRVYRIRRGSGQVQLEGRSLTSQCSLKSEEPAMVARRLLSPRVTLPRENYLVGSGSGYTAVRSNPYLLPAESLD